MAVDIRPITTREAWLDWRRTVVTASRIGALPAFDCHPYYTPLRLYAEMRGVEFPNDDDNPALRRGRWLEPAVAKAVSELRPDWEIEAPDHFLFDPEINIGATPDFYIYGDPRGRGVLQVKTVAPSVYARDWDDGAEIPLWITLQTLTEAMLSNSRFGAVAVMLVDPHRMDVKILDVPRHAGAEIKLVTEVDHFMKDVRAGIEPDPDYARDGTVLRMMLPREIKDRTIDLSGSNELTWMLEQRAELMAEIKTKKLACEQIENKIRHIMGDAAIALGVDNFSVTYKTSHFSGYTVDPRDSRVLRIRDRRPLEQRPKGSSDDD